MGFGIALGGAAKGLESAENALARNKQLALTEQSIMGDQKLRERALGIQEKQMERSAQNDLRSQANSILAEELKVVGEVIKAGQAAGHSPEQISAAIEPLMADIEELAPTVGRDPARIRTMVGATLNSPGMADPADRVKQLQADKLTREAAGDVARLEDVAFSASDALEALDTLEKVPGGEVFLLNPGLISPARQALASKDGGGLLGKLQRALGVNELPKQLTGLSESQLLIALDAAETVSKQRNALATGLSNQAGTAGLRSQLQARGEGAGLSVQRKVFGQALDLANRELGKDVSTGPLPLPGTEAELKKGQVYNLADGRQALWNGNELELLN